MRENVQSLSRAFAVLEAFSFDKTEMTMSEIASAVDLPVSTTARLLSTLVEGGYLKKNERKYYLGYKLFYLGNIASMQFNLDRVIEPIMQDLVNETGDLVSLSVIANYHRVCIKKIEGTSLIRRHINVGEPQPLYAGSGGKVLLAYQGETYWDEYFSVVKLDKLTPNTEIDPPRIRETLRQIRKDGYSLSFAERIIGSISASAPIFNKEGVIEACLTVGVVSLSSTLDTQKLVELVRQGTSRASKEIGYLGE